MDSARLHALLDVNRSLMAELDSDAVLRRLLHAAREQTGAAHAGIGVPAEARAAAIGDDPAMRTVVEVPITVRGELSGTLHLAGKAGGVPFSDEDEEVAGALAQSAAVAIENAHRFRGEHVRRRELERANRVLETTTDLSRALGGVTDVDRTLELVAERSRSLLGTRTAELAVLEGDEFVIRAVAGFRGARVVGTRIPVDRSIARDALRTGRTQRYDRVPEESFARRRLDAKVGIATPLVFRGRALGVLVVLDRIGSERPFTDDDVRVLEAFGATAATALATAQTAADEALRRSIEASETERRRWARELHDETLQELAGLRVLLAGARRAGDPAQLEAAVDEATDLLAVGVADLRALITDVRPASLDDLGVRAALDTLVTRVRTTSGLDVQLETDLAWERGDRAGRLDAEVETTVYRLVQEALTNAAKHAHAEHIHVRVAEADDVVDIRVRDDGAGFDPSASGTGFGLVGMRERLAVVRGSVRVDSAPGAGTTVHARIPAFSRATVSLESQASS